MKAIGDNLILVARSKRYTAKQFRELFLWAIGEAGETPPEGCEEAAEFILADQRGMEERLAKRKAAKAERQARWKTRRDARDAKDAEDVHLPAIPTSLPANINNENVINTRTHAKPPTLEAVLAWAADGIRKPDGKPIPETFAREWFAIQEAAEPAWTNTRGRNLAGNWRQEMIYAWRRECSFNRTGKPTGAKTNTNQPEGVYHDEGEYENPF